MAISVKEKGCSSFTHPPFPFLKHLQQWKPTVETEPRLCRTVGRVLSKCCILPVEKDSEKLKTRLREERSQSFLCLYPFHS